MREVNRLSRRIGRVFRAGFVVAVAVMSVLLWNIGLGGFMALTVLGGLALGFAFRLANRRRAPSSSVPDRFAHDAFSTDTLNFAHVRVTGVGGFGLVLVALAMALDFALVGAVLLAGLIGGVIAAGAVILYRRRNGPLSSSASGPGARGVLFSEPRALVDEPKVDRPKIPRHTVTVSV